MLAEALVCLEVATAMDAVRPPCWFLSVASPLGPKLGCELGLYLASQEENGLMLIFDRSDNKKQL